MSDRPCDYCDRQKHEIASCPSAHATACASRSFNVMLGAVQRLQKKLAATGNYIANAETDPTEILFANGRTVKIIAGSLVVGWDRPRAATVFEDKDSRHAQCREQEKP